MWLVGGVASWLLAGWMVVAKQQPEESSELSWAPATGQLRPRRNKATSAKHDSGQGEAAMSRRGGRFQAGRESWRRSGAKKNEIDSDDDDCLVKKNNKNKNKKCLNM